MAIELPKTEPSMQNRRVVALVSGGKDSLFNLYLAKEYYKNEIVALVNLKPPPTAESDEMDSYMYQTVGHQAIESIAEAIDLPLYRATITGKETNTDLVYKNDDQRDDEVEQLHALLRKMLDDGLKFDAISVGAIASSYQKHRVEHVCERLNLKMLAYLWDQDQDKLLQAMIDSGFNAILIKVACMGLTEHHVGRSIKDMQDLLRKLNREYRTNICGEGGEYETLVLDCPLYKKALKLESYEIICHSHDVFAPVYYMKPTKISLVEVDENRFDKRRNSASSNSNSTSSSSPVANFNSKS